MFGWLISVVLLMLLIVFGKGTGEKMTPGTRPAKASSTVGLRKPVHIPTVSPEDLAVRTPGLKSALKSADGLSSNKKSIKWAERADYRSITPKGRIIDKTVKI